MNNAERHQIMKTFVRMIEHLSNKEYQKKAWINGEEADFDEFFCIFFGDGDSILDNYKDYNITEEQNKLLKTMCNEFKIFANTNNYPEQFLDTPEWMRITKMAREVLKAFSSPNNVYLNEEHGVILRAQMEKPHVVDLELKKHVDCIYRPDASIGSGSTAAAIRHELITGGPVRGKLHSQKGREKINSLERWLRNHPNAAAGDRSAAENILKDLYNALREPK